MLFRGRLAYQAPWATRNPSHAFAFVSSFLSLLILTVMLPCCFSMEFTMSEQRRMELKNTAKEMFLFGWNNYIEYAYPADELNPILCNGRGSDRENPDNININDILGDYSLTMIDTLDTLAILGEQKEFEKAVERVIKDVSFNQNNKVQVFELNIRALGGLLSAHLLASDPSLGHTISGYQGELLDMARDLADRLLPAFQHTKTGIPYPRVNLRYGVPRTETVETCTAGAGSLLLEFGVLSRLTNDPHYEDVAKRALKALWDRRSDIDLLGNVINIQTGQWIHTASSTGAGIDSFFEYLLKAHVLFGEDEYLEMFKEAYEAIMQHVRDPTGYLYRNVHMSTGALMSTWIDSLSAFWPGLQVLYGDLDSAIKGHLVFYNIWRKYHALPERFDFYRKSVDIGFYPLRPEFVESTYYLYRATRDPFYLHVGEMVIEELNNRTRLPCGFASIGDVRTGRLEDRMESFLLSETMKYLYLLFDTDNEFNKMDSNFVFTTEGHFLPLGGQYLKNNVQQQSATSPTCYAYKIGQTSKSHYIQYPDALDMSSVPYLPGADFAAFIVGYNKNSLDDIYPNGQCMSPLMPSRSFDITFNHLQRQGELYTSPRLVEIVGGFFAKSLSGLKIEITKRSLRDGGDAGYEITRVYPNIRLSKDSVLLVTMDAIEEYVHYSDILEFDLPAKVPVLETDQHEIQIRAYGSQSSRVYYGIKSEFGPPFSLREADIEAAVFLQDEQRLLGCDAYTSTDDQARIRGRVLIVSRGLCTFYQKAVRAQDAGARAVVFVNNQVGSKVFRALKGSVESDIPKDTVVRIPSMTMSLEDGADLTHFIETVKEEEEGALPQLTFIKPVEETMRMTHTSAVIVVREPLKLKLNGQLLHNLMVLRS